ncbi:MAG TPA: rRNA adenine dimethyltransferase family protein, partial [Candidatus Polarisedimenticolaceae bacterium]|nr:rRNA adenine dimethyltransferase family protein [Candidatus Polarisedimenticolaceae bacterium]
MDAGAAQRIVAALEARPGDAVLEIGPGRGALTGWLIAAAGRVCAIELDETLATALAARFDAARLVLLRGDVLELELATAARALGAESVRLRIAGNLPYAISKPLALRLVAQCAHVERAVLMYQREVARRLTARPGSRDYGPLTVLAGEAFRIEALFELGPGAFRPPPAVVSTVTVWVPRAEPPAPEQQRRL